MEGNTLDKGSHTYDQNFEVVHISFCIDTVAQSDIHVHCFHSHSLFTFTFQYILFFSVLALDIGVLFSHSYSVENYYNHGIPS